MQTLYVIITKLANNNKTWKRCFIHYLIDKTSINWTKKIHIVINLVILTLVLFFFRDSFKCRDYKTNLLFKIPTGRYIPSFNVHSKIFRRILHSSKLRSDSWECFLVRSVEDKAQLLVFGEFYYKHIQDILTNVVTGFFCFSNFISSQTQQKFLILVSTKS